MSSLKAIKRKAKAPGPYREALIELGHLREQMDKFSFQSGDTVLFKLDEHSRMTQQMITVFMDVAEERGIQNIQAFLLKPGESVATLSPQQFDQFARALGYEKIPTAEDRKVYGIPGQTAVFTKQGGDSDGGRVLPSGNEEQPNGSSPEGGEKEGLRAEETSALVEPEQRLFSDEEVSEILDPLSEAPCMSCDGSGIAPGQILCPECETVRLGQLAKEELSVTSQSV